MFANITAIDVNCTDIDRKRDSKSHGGSAVLVDLEKIIEEFEVKVAP